LTYFKLHAFARAGKGATTRELSHSAAKPRGVASRYPSLY